jgi:hypothetical protein
MASSAAVAFIQALSIVAQVTIGVTKFRISQINNPRRISHGERTRVRRSDARL